MQENQTQEPRTKEEAKTICRCPVFRILFFLVLIIGAVSGLSLVFTGSSNPLDYFVPVDPPGLSESYRWDAVAGLERLVMVRQHSKKEETKIRCTISLIPPSPGMFLLFRMHAIQPGRRLLTNQLRTGTLANLLIYAPKKFHMSSIAIHPMGV
jgi:hypothetical protein